MRVIKDLIFICMLASFPLFGAGSWSPPDTVGTPISNSPDVAMDSKGNAVALWVFTEGNNTSIKAATRAAGGNWSTPVTLSPANLQTLYGGVAIDHNGNAIAVWSVSNGLAQCLQAAVLPFADPFGSNEWISTALPAFPTESIATPPKVAFDAKGNALVVWGDYEGGGYAIQAAWMNESLSWKPVREFAVDTVSTISLAVDPSGNAVILWKGCEDGSNPCIKSATLLKDSTAWTLQDTLSTADLIASPQVVVDGQGHAVAAWWENRWDKGTMTIRAMTLPLGANAWQETQFPDVTCFYSRLAMDGSGTAHIMWSAYGTGQPYAFQSSLLKPAESTWTSPATILPASSDYMPYYGFGVDQSGNAVAVWGNHTAGKFEASLQRAGDSEWSSPVTLAPIEGNGGVESWPRVSLSENGSCGVIYSECADPSEGIVWINAVTAICGKNVFKKN
ncbi:MAG: hypothetical protein LLG04_18435 [Parachlamydia sp.]|nr:hypothetical protein [Parachlamydia sp.]